MHRVGGRTFLLTLGCGIVASLLLWFGKLDGGSYTTLILGTVGAYIGANAYQRGVEVRADAQVQISTGVAGTSEGENDEIDRRPFDGRRARAPASAGGDDER